MSAYLKEIFKPFNYTLMKVEIAGVISAILAGISSFSENYLGISGAFTLVLFILLVVDFITGVSASRYLKDKITSKKGLRTVYKAGAYLLFMYVSFQLHKELEGRANLLESIIEYFHIYIIIHISFWELFSVDENFKKLGIDLGITNILKSVYQNIKSIFLSMGKQNKTNEL